LCYDLWVGVDEFAAQQLEEIPHDGSSTTTLQRLPPLLIKFQILSSSYAGLLSLASSLHRRRCRR
jgi:hypothetical protein